MAMARTKVKLFEVRKRLCPSGVWDNGSYMKSKNVVEIPLALMAEAVIVRFPEGVKGVPELVSRIDLRGQSYLVVGSP